MTPFAVPLDSNARINENELRRYLRWLISKGISGVFSNGSTGEFTRFTSEERKQITRIVVEEVHGRILAVAGVAEANTKEVLEFCSDYSDLGCDFVALCSPYYFKLSQESLLEYFSEVALQSPIPILLYNIPAFTNSLSVDTIEDLARNDRIAGIKDSSRDLPTFLHLMRRIRPSRPDFIFLTGTDEMLYPSLIMGADGGIVASSGVVPETMIGLYEAFRKGNQELAMEIQYHILDLISLMYGVDFPAGFRAAVSLRGFDMGPGRQPLSNGDKDKIDVLKRKMTPIIERIIKNRT